MKSISCLLGLLAFAALTSCHTSHTTVNTNSQKKLPSDAAKIDLPVSEGIKDNFTNFVKLGYQKGEKVNDFTLYSLDGTKYSLSEILTSNKPLLLISGSYTCDISRRNMPDINLLTARYKGKINTYIVYTIDAHPSDIASPYSANNRVDIASANTRDHIEAQQAKTYGERKVLAKKWQQQNALTVPVLVDTPTNDFWLAFGQAPNMAYLINPDGTVYYKQVWFKFSDLDDSIRNWLHTQPKNTTSP
ncbi:TlpA family protein disulfide reductase [Spirosoma pollinicola]|nr:deiodinase-like protein [Spirosoma pollinicola]